MIFKRMPICIVKLKLDTKNMQSVNRRKLELYLYSGPNQKNCKWIKHLMIKEAYQEDTSETPYTLVIEHGVISWYWPDSSSPLLVCFHTTWRHCEGFGGGGKSSTVIPSCDPRELQRWQGGNMYPVCISLRNILEVIDCFLIGPKVHSQWGKNMPGTTKNP